MPWTWDDEWFAWNSLIAFEYGRRKGDDDGTSDDERESVRSER